MLKSLLALTVVTLSMCAIARAETNTPQNVKDKLLPVDNCKRQAPIGEFDRRCDVPALGWRGAEGLWLPGVSQGAG